MTSQCRGCGQEIGDRLGQLCLECTAAAWENDGDRYLWISPEADRLRRLAAQDAARYGLGLPQSTLRLARLFWEREHEYREATDPMQDHWHEDRAFPGQESEP